MTITLVVYFYLHINNEKTTILTTRQDFNPISEKVTSIKFIVACK